MKRSITTALAALALVGVVGCGAETGTATGAATDTTTSDVLSNSDNDSHPPARDVKITDCTVDNDYGFNMATADLTVTNHSSKASDYSITVEFIARDGSRVGEGYAFVSALRPGKIAKEQAVGESGGKTRLKCRISTVERWSAEG